MTGEARDRDRGNMIHKSMEGKIKANNNYKVSPINPAIALSLVKFSPLQGFMTLLIHNLYLVETSHGLALKALHESLNNAQRDNSKK